MTGPTPPSVEELRQAILQQRLRKRMEQHSAADDARSIARTDRTQPLPLSLAQQRLWFLDRLDESAAYHIPSAMRLTGRLDRAALKATLDRLVARHESLRTRFTTIDGVPHQAIASADGGFALREHDLSGLAPAAQQDEVARLAGEEAQARFDLATGPLIRGRLLRLGAQEHVLLITQHHIVTDGWSLAVMVREVAALYTAFSQGQADPLPALEIQYADYAVWQRKWLRGEALERQLGFWRTHLDGAPALLELPTDRPRPAVQCHEGANVAFALSAQLSAQLRALAQDHGCTLFMVLLAGWSVLLSRLSGQREVVVGTPVANRHQRDVEGLIGFFVNTLALRVDLRSDASVAELLAQVKATTLSAFDHPELPFEQVVEALRPQRSLGYSPVFQAMLVLNNTPDGGPLELPGLTLAPLATDRTTTHFDLSLSLTDVDAQLTGSINYARGLFDRTTIERWAGHYETVLQGMVADARCSLASLPLLTAAQRKQLLKRFNATATDYPHEALIHELFEAQAAAQPQAQAVEYQDQRLTYGELNARANQVAHYLIGLGVGPDDRVAIRVRRSLDLVVGLLGILKAGGAYVPLDPDYPPERQAYMLEDCAPVALLTQTALAVDLPDPGVPVLRLDSAEADERLATQPTGNPQRSADGLGSRNLAYVIYTSGSTGRPKGVMVEHRSAVNFWQVMTRTTHRACAARSRVALNAAFSFDMSLKGVLQLLSGHCLVLIPQEIRASGPELLAFLQARRIDALDSTPSQLEGLLAAGLLEPGPDEHHPRTVLLGGEPIGPALWQRLKASSTVQFHNMYGPTEATVDATIACIAEMPGGPVIGGPIANNRIYILDDHGEPVPLGVAGELHIAGVGVARGYLNRPELTAERFVRDPFGAQAGGRMYKTGDLGRWLPDGTIEFVGRNDFQVKIRGFRIELGEIEAELLACEGVREAVVLAREDASGGKRLVAYVVAQAQAEPIAAQLREALQGRLPEYMVPSAFVALESLPLTPNGKLDRQALPVPGLEAVAARAYEAPQGEAEQLLARIWAELLGMQRVGRNDHFFELGGHSLLVVAVVERLREAGLRMAVQAIFTAPVLHALAATLSRESATAESQVPKNLIAADTTHITPALLPLVSLSKEEIDRIVATVPGGTSNVQDIYPLLPLQEGFLFHHLLEEEGDTYLSRDVLAFDSREHLDGFLDALNQVIARHDILRSAVQWQGLSQPVQVVYRRASLPVHELVLPQTGPAARALHEYTDLGRMRLDIRRAPVLAAYVAQDPAQGEWLLALLRHHIVCDHLTLELAQAEVNVILRGERAALPQALPFRTVVAQTRQMSMAEHESYFRQELGDIDEPTAPFGMMNVQLRGTQMAESVLPLEAELSRRIRVCSRREGLSPAVLFHVAWAQVLGRCTGREEVVFGTVLSGRLQGIAGADRVLGMAINTLPLRVSLGDRSVRQVVQESARRMQWLLAHEHAPLALAQRCSGVPQPLPLFTTLLNYRHSDANASSLGDAEQAHAHGMRFISGGGDHANFPLSVRVDDLGDGFAVRMEAMEGIDGERVSGYLLTAIAGLVDALGEKTEVPEYKVDVLPRSERQQLLQGFNAMAAAYPHEALIHELFEAQAVAQSDADAMVYEDQRLTYGELNARANQVAHYLLAQGVRPDDRVAICVERSLEMVVGLLGILKAGGGYVPLDPDYPAERLAYMLGDSAPVAMLTQVKLEERLPVHSVPTLRLDTDEAQRVLAAQPTHNPELRARGLTSRHLAYVIYTSGSTGTPKGVMVEHANVVRLFAATQDWFHFGDRDTWTLFHSFAFDFSVWELWGALLHGGRLVVVPYTINRSPRDFYELLCREGVTVLNQTPSAFRQLIAAQSSSAALHQLRYVVFGGEALEVATLRPWYQQMRNSGTQLINMYGITETTVHVTYRPLRVEDCERGASPIGRQIPDLRVYILDSRGEPVPLGVAGELYIGGAGVARGYLNRPELTAERFVADPFSGDKDARLYRTGDMGRWRPDGSIEYLGRNDFQVKLRGFRIELGEIEAQLQRCAGVREAVVLAREDRPGDKRLVAYVVAAEGAQPSVPALREALARTLAEYMVPGAFVLLDALPLTANGKLDRKALPAPGLEAVAARAYEAPQGEVEQALARIWAELLGVERVGRHDHFFELGGHSLMALQVATRIRQHFEVDVALTDIFRYPELADLADQILVAVLALYSSDELAVLQQEIEALSESSQYQG